MKKVNELIEKIEYLILNVRKKSIILRLSNQLKFHKYLRTIWQGIKASIITIIAVVSSIAFSALTNHSHLEFTTITSLLIGYGAAIMGIPIFAFSLSIIAVQKASETWSPGIVKLYKEDRNIYLFIISFSIFIISAFVLAAINTDIFSQIYVVSISVIGLAIVLDLLRGYYRYVCDLLHPSKAIEMIKLKTIYQIKKHKKYSTLISRLYVVSAQPKDELKNYESIFYFGIKDHGNIIKENISNLIEMACRATSRGEDILSSLALQAVYEIIDSYLNSRKNNIVIIPSSDNPLAFKTDADSVLNYTYDAISRANDIAIMNKSVITANAVLVTYANIARSACQVALPGPFQNGSSLGWSPLFWLIECAKKAQNIKLADIPYRSTGIITNLVYTLPKELQINDMISLSVDWFISLAVNFQQTNQNELTNKILERLMQISFHVLKINYRGLQEALSEIFNNIFIVVRGTAMNDKDGAHCMIGSSMRSVYSLTTSTSISRLLLTAKELAELKSDISDDRYVDFLIVSDEIIEHLRYIVEKIVFTNYCLLSEIIASINKISKIFIDIILNQAACSKPDYRFVDKLLRHLSFLSAVFNNKSVKNLQCTREACEVLAYTSIWFTKIPLFAIEVISKCIQDQIFIIKSYIQATHNAQASNIALLLIYVWQVRIAANKTGLIKIADDIDKIIPEFLVRYHNYNLLQTLEAEKDRLNQYLAAEKNIFDRETSERLLRDVISEISK